MHKINCFSQNKLHKFKLSWVEWSSVYEDWRTRAVECQSNVILYDGRAGQSVWDGGGVACHLFVWMWTSSKRAEVCVRDGRCVFVFGCTLYEHHRRVILSSACFNKPRWWKHIVLFHIVCQFVFLLIPFFYIFFFLFSILSKLFYSPFFVCV